MRIGGASITTGRDEHGAFCLVRFEDNAEILSRPRDDPSYAATAGKTGYESVEAMCLEHDYLHQQLAAWLGLSESPTLAAAARGRPMPFFWGEEEDAVLALARLINALRRANLLPDA